MPAPHPTLNVRILDRVYTLDAAADTHPRLKEAARQLDSRMRAQQAHHPSADATQLAILTALELVRASQASRLHERDIGKSLTALQRKLDRLDVAMSTLESVPPDESLAKN